MNKLISAMLAATGMVAAVASSPTAAWSQTAPAFQNKRYFTMPLENESDT